MSNSNSPKRVYRGVLSKTHELEKLFKILDEYTIKGDESKPYTERRYKKYGMYEYIKEQLGGDRKTVLNRINDHPLGLKIIERRGSSSKKDQKWIETECYQAIKEYPECWEVDKNGRGKLTQKGKNYERSLKLAFELTKTDPLDMDLNQWLLCWGNPSKARNAAPKMFTDPMTQRLRYDAAIHFRFAMTNSNAPDISALITKKDRRFDVKDLKRPKGLHKEEFQSEEQIKTLPEFLQNTEILMLDYMGVLFGGRFDALKELKPADVKREFGVINFYEGKVDRDVPKDIFEPEVSFIWRYITDKKLAINEKLFPRSISHYNAQLTKAGQELGKKYPHLKFINDKGEEWNLTTHKCFKHTCVSQMTLHGVRRDVVSDYIGTDEATLKEFYQGGGSANIKHEIGGIAIKQQEPTWRAFVIALTKIFEQRYNELIKAHRVDA